MVNIKDKISQIESRAKSQLTEIDDQFAKVTGYLNGALELRERSKLHNEKKVVAAFAVFAEKKQQIEDKYETDKELAISDKFKELQWAYTKYAAKKASLDRLDDATLFYDSVSDMYVRIIRYEQKEKDGSSHERLRVDRFKPTTIKKYIDLESKQLIGTHLDSAQVTSIMREFKPYIKVFEPCQETFYKGFFNTYIPNGFLDITVKNEVNLEKFTTITLPKRYPIINALLENIAPYVDERVFLLNWLSTIFNIPKKTRTAIILKGIQRTGKGVFVSKIIEHALNEENCFTATNANLSENFNNYLEDKLFIKFDEVKGDFHKDKDIANKIKLIVSEENISIRSMHVNPYMIRFYANCIFLSNEELPIPMDQSDERLTVIETQSKTLAQVAKEKFNKDIHEFIDLLEKERDQFIIHLKMCEFNKQLASSTIQNKTKRAIQDATSTTQAMLKTAFRGQEIDKIEEILLEAIEDKQHETLIKNEVEVLQTTVDGKFKVKKQIPFNHDNQEMKQIFMDEFKAGMISNTSLKWFSIITNIEHILKSDLKFGNFWNLILSQAVLIKLKFLDGSTKSEKFRTITPHTEINTFHFDKHNFTFTGKKTAIQAEGSIPF